MIDHVEYPPIEALIDAHSREIQDRGGIPGIRDREGLEAALARAEQVRAYADGHVTIFALAAAISYAICKVHHPFADGNKRVAFIALFMTLHMNGYFLDVSESDATDTILKVASGDIDEGTYTRWVAENTVAMGDK